MWQIFVISALLHYAPHVASDVAPAPRTANGFVATLKEFPYQLHLVIYVNRDEPMKCGAVLVSNRMALSAAHCFPPEFDWVEVFFGVLNTEKYTMGRQKLKLAREDIVLHPRFDLTTNTSDIAILHLPADIELSDYIQPVKLPEIGKSYDDLVGVVSGFDSSETATSHLRYYYVSTISNRECQSLIESRKNDVYFSSSFLCLKPSERSPRSGDAGSPFVVYNKDGSKTLLGITSFGFDDICDANFTTVYTRVSSFLCWIEKHR